MFCLLAINRALEDGHMVEIMKQGFLAGLLFCAASGMCSNSKNLRRVCIEALQIINKRLSFYSELREVNRCLKNIDPGFEKVALENAILKVRTQWGAMKMQVQKRAMLKVEFDRRPEAVCINEQVSAFVCMGHGCGAKSLYLR